MHHRLFSTVLLSLVVIQSESSADDEEFRDLFNGKDLSNWVLVNTPPDTWSIRDGMLVCSGKPIGEIRTDRMYQNFILELEWRHMVPRGNAGVFVWADDITARGVPFHRSIEVQVLENAYGNIRSHTTHGDIFPIHGAKMVPDNGRGGSRSFPTENRSKPSPEWNHYRITCTDGRITLAVNGKVVTSGRECSPRKGYICLESEGGIVHYRNVRIKELPDSSVKAEHVAIANRGYRSIYSGLDLRGWKASDADRWHAKDWVLAFDGSEKVSQLNTTETQSVAGFVVDVKAKKSYDGTSIQLRSGSDSAVVIDLGDNKAVSQYLEDVGRWNRFEGTIAGGELTLTVNGNEVESRSISVPASATGSIVLSASASTDFANVYVRELPAE